MKTSEPNKSPLTIIRLESQNVKRLTAVEITPSGELVIIGGNNAQGKSSVLDSISMALGGKTLQCEMPLRKGTKKGHTIIDLGEFTVKRTYTEGGGGTITVENKEGARYPSPQAILDRLNSTLTFDPLAFSRLKPKEQLETLRQLVGVDTTTIDQERKETYDLRTVVNRDVDRLRAERDALKEKIEDTERPESAPAMASLTDKLKEAEETNRANDKARSALAELKRELDSANSNKRSAERLRDENYENEVKGREQKIKGAEAKVARIRSELEAAELEVSRLINFKPVKLETYVENAAKIITELGARVLKGEKYCTELADIDTAPILEQIEAFDQRAQLYRHWQELDAKTESASACKAKSDALTAKIEKLDDDRRKLIASAQYPIPGMELGENSILLNGIPMSQASQAETIRVSIAMGAALNPRLRVLLIRDASLLDDNGLKMVAEIAKEMNLQIWCERVGKGKECSVIIEDGMVESVNAEPSLL